MFNNEFDSVLPDLTDYIKCFELMLDYMFWHNYYVGKHWVLNILKTGRVIHAMDNILILATEDHRQVLVHEN